MKEDDTLYISKESLSELIKWNKELFDKCCKYWEDNQRLFREKEELYYENEKLKRELEIHENMEI